MRLVAILALSLVAGQASAQNGPYLFDVLMKGPYRTAWEKLMKQVQPTPDWLLRFSRDFDGVSGVRFGYSQIANPLYLLRKGTMTVRTSLRFVSRNLLSNTLRSVSGRREVDYAGRLRGNAVAIFDVLRGRSHPMRVVDVR